MNENRIHYIDSHTEGEPTRVLTSGLPPLGDGPVSAKLEVLRRHDWVRRCAILEPRGWDALVGAVLCEPHEEGCAAGVIFINNAGYLNMCGHGTIGLAVTLYEMGRIGLGKSRIDTPVGVVEIELLDANTVAIANVPSYRSQRSVSVEVPGIGTVSGDVAWGGNWFFLAESAPCEIELSNLATLTEAARRLRRALEAANITGADGGLIDHIEFFAPGSSAEVHSRNYVYCPGGAYDRSPCGTGTSAKLACLAADGKLKPGESWVQESIIGSRFTGSYQWADEEKIIPRIVGQAFICSEGQLRRQPEDPFANGIGSGSYSG